MAGPTVGCEKLRAGPRLHGCETEAPASSPEASALGYASAPGASQALTAADLLPPLTRLDPHNAVGLAMTMGLVIFATTLALLHMRERRRWARSRAQRSSRN